MHNMPNDLFTQRWRCSCQMWPCISLHLFLKLQGLHTPKIRSLRVPKLQAESSADRTIQICWSDWWTWTTRSGTSRIRCKQLDTSNHTVDTTITHIHGKHGRRPWLFREINQRRKAATSWIGISISQQLFNAMIWRICKITQGSSIWKGYAAKLQYRCRCFGSSTKQG